MDFSSIRERNASQGKQEFSLALADNFFSFFPPFFLHPDCSRKKFTAIRFSNSPLSTLESWRSANLSKINRERFCLPVDGWGGRGREISGVANSVVRSRGSFFSLGAAIFTRHPSMKFRFAVEAWCDFFKKAGEGAKKGDDVSR